jgi:hypothetical protein
MEPEARHYFLSSARRIQTTPSDPISLRSTLTFSSHLRLGLPSGLFPSGFPTKKFGRIYNFSLRATFPVHLFLTWSPVDVSHIPFWHWLQTWDSYNSHSWRSADAIVKSVGTGKRVMRTGVWLETSNWSNSLEDTVSHERMILKCILEKQSVRMATEFHWSCALIKTVMDIPGTKAGNFLTIWPTV